MFPYTLNRDRKLHCTKADRTQYLNSSNLFNSLTKSELEMCKIQTSKLTHTEHHENTWSQVSTDFLPKPSQQSRTQISPQHNESQTREENPKKKKKEKTYTADGFWLYNVCLDACVAQKKQTTLGHYTVLSSAHPGRWEYAKSSDLSVTRVPRVEWIIRPPTLLADDRAVNETARNGLRLQLTGQVGRLLQFSVQRGALAIWRAVGTAVWNPLPLFFAPLVG